MDTNQNYTHIVSLGGEEHYVNQDNFQAVCDALYAKFKEVPQVKSIEAAKPQGVPEVTNTIDDNKPIISGGINIVGAVRATRDEELATKAGFAVAPPIYTIGTAVNSLGVENAIESRRTHEQKPTVGEYCDSFIAKIQAEDRKDFLLSKRDVRLSKIGRLVSGEDRLWLNRDAFNSLVTRMGMGGAEYLSKCEPELRAININQWALRLGKEEDTALEEFKKCPPKRGRGRKKSFKNDVFNFRTRVNASIEDGTREVFGVVTDSYTPFDVDKVAQALKLASPSDARGTVTYDGGDARFEVLFHSDVAANEYVAGEIFKAGVVIKTADDGTGGLNVWACVWRNLCLNLIIIDEAKIPTARIRHIGDVNKLAAKFQEGFKDALKRIVDFRAAWGYAVTENVIERSQVTTTQDIPMKIEDALPGFFNAIIERDMVSVAGYRRKEAVASLVRAYEKDPANNPNMVTRAALVNAFTRFAHEDPQASPWAQDNIQAAAGAMLFGLKGKAPEAIPYLSMDELIDDEE